MFGCKHYVPNLLWKEGEETALGSLGLIHKAHITPFIQVAPLDYDFKKNCYKKTIEKHLEKLIKKINSAWQYQFFLDTTFVDEHTLADKRLPAEFIFDEAIRNKTKLIPVIKSDTLPIHMNIVKRYSDITQSGYCIRLKPKDFSSLTQILQKLISYMNCPIAQTDLILDLDYIQLNMIDWIINSITNFYYAIPNLDEWRTITVMGTSMPKDMSGIAQNSISTVPRGEWRIWNYLYKTLGENLVRIPSFGDYGICHPEPFDGDARIMKPSATIRYTSNTEFLLFKGTNLKKDGYDQYHKLSSDIINHPAYSGSFFSEGDKFIYECALKIASTGNLTTWKTVGTSHHLTFVSTQIAK